MLTLGLQACYPVGPNYKLPLFGKMPESWQQGTANASSTTPLPSLAWWQSLNDPTLDTLIQTSRQNNGDLKVAAARVTEARAARIGAISNLLPQINGSVSGKRGNSGVGTTDQVANSFEAGFDASWEIDIFGGNLRASEASAAVLGSRQASERQVRISLLGEMVRAYADYRRLEEQTRLTEENLKAQQETLTIVKAQMAEGIASMLDVSRIEAQTALTDSKLPELQSQLIATRNNIAVLAGLTPAEIPALLTSGTMPSVSNTVLLSTPAETIANRPDVQVAERDLAAATANQGVAISNWFPKVSLTGLFGLQDTLYLSTVDTWNAGGTIRLPILDFGRVNALVKQADARQVAAFATYEQTIKIALADIETSLAAYAKAQEQQAILTRAAGASKQAEELSRIHFREGLGSLLDVLVAQRERLDTESSLASSRANVIQRYASLYKALGGGADVSQTIPLQNSPQP